MATPIGHSLFGFVFARFAQCPSLTLFSPWFLFVILAANAPDFNFLLGPFCGDANRFYQASHSFTAAVLFQSKHLAIYSIFLVLQNCAWVY